VQQQDGNRMASDVVCNTGGELYPHSGRVLHYMHSDARASCGVKKWATGGSDRLPFLFLLSLSLYTGAEYCCIVLYFAKGANAINGKVHASIGVDDIRGKARK